MNHSSLRFEHLTKYWRPRPLNLAAVYIAVALLTTSVCDAEERAVAVALGYYQAVYIDADAVLWGCGAVTQSAYLNAPAPIKSGIRSVAAGGDNTVAVDSAGMLWSMLVAGPNRLDTPLATNVVQASTGGSLPVGSHTAFLKQDGSVWTVGSNGVGQLGDGTLDAKTEPVRVGEGASFVFASSGGCTFMLKADGSLWATGTSGVGLFGNGSVRTTVTSFTQVGNDVADVSSSVHTLIVRKDGTLWATGSNQYGQLGTGDTTDRATAVQIMSGVRSAYAGLSHSVVLKADGTLWTFGDNSYGQLGDGTQISRSAPVQIAIGVASAAASSLQTAFIKTDGSLWAAGTAVGRLTNGYTNEDKLPVKVLPGSPPVILTQPYDRIVKVNYGAGFTATADGMPRPSYRWFHDGVAMRDGVGTFPHLVTFGDLGDRGAYYLEGTNRYGKSVSRTVRLDVVDTSARSRVVNISGRAYCGSADQVAIGGFVINGTTTRRVLIRAVGPSLTQYGLAATEVLSDPRIELHHGSAIVGNNDNWRENENTADILATAARLGAAPLAANDNTSAAMLVSLAPGVYSFIANGPGTGIVLLEVYDANPGETNGGLVNISMRAFAKTGDQIAIGGFVVSGTAPKQVLLRAVGPMLTTQGINAKDAMEDPIIEVHAASKGNVVVAANDNWGDDSMWHYGSVAAKRVGATPLGSDKFSSAILVSLAPGPYSFTAKSKTDQPGIVLFEVYDADDVTTPWY